MQFDDWLKKEDLTILHLTKKLFHSYYRDYGINFLCTGVWIAYAVQLQTEEYKLLCQESLQHATFQVSRFYRIHKVSTMYTQLGETILIAVLFLHVYKLMRNSTMLSGF